MSARTAIVGATLVAILAGLASLNVGLFFSGRDVRNEDIFMTYCEGNTLAHGRNPCSRTMACDMRDNHAKYPTYLPLSYLLSAACVKIGLDDFAPWVSVWRILFALAQFAIGAALFHVFLKRRRPWLGALAAAIWWLNRWTLFVVYVAHVDFVSILFVILSLIFFKKRPWMSLVFFGVSLAWKHLAIFLGPLYVIWMWQDSPVETRRKRSCLALAAMAAVPLLLSLPFMVMDFSGFAKSIMLSATRRGDYLGYAPSIELLYAVDGGLLGRLPMLGLMALVFAASFMKHIGRWAAAMLVMMIFLYFNPVLYAQYQCWLVPLIFLALAEFVEGQRDEVGKTAAPETS